MQIQFETIEPGRPPKDAKFFGAVAREVPLTSSRAIRLYCLGKRASDAEQSRRWFNVCHDINADPEMWECDAK